MRGVKEQMDFQTFLKEFGNQPIEKMDLKTAQEILYMAGIFTKQGKYTAKYKKISTQNMNKKHATSTVGLRSYQLYR